jgi:NAD(P) transhydrogenase
MTASRDHYEFVSIGGGPAGQSAAELATLFGRRALVVERQTLGGVVVTNAGIPTKTLREAAQHITGFRARDMYGLSFQHEPHVVLERLRARTGEVLAQVQDAVRSSFVAHGIDVLYGTAALGPNRTVVVTPNDRGPMRTITADVILLATGSQPLRPPGIPFDDPRVFDSEKLLELQQVPGSVVVVGGGAIGCEYASIFTALGVPVTLVDTADRLMSMMDGELSRLAARVFEGQGMRVLCGRQVSAVVPGQDGLEVQLASGEVLRPDALLFAGGRSVVTDGLGLKEAGVDTTPRGWVVVDENYRTSTPGIYAAGDVIGPTLASVAMEQGRVVVSNAFGLGVKELAHPLPVSAVYAIPQVAGVGQTEEQARAAGVAYEVGCCSFAMLPAAIISGHTEGMLKLVFASDDLRLLGVHSLGEIAADLVALGHVVVHDRATLELFNDLTFANPTYTMAYKDAAFDGLKRVARARNCEKRLP